MRLSEYLVKWEGKTVVPCFLVVEGDNGLETPIMYDGRDPLYICLGGDPTALPIAFKRGN